jgi:hypothetical protein
MRHAPTVSEAKLFEAVRGGRLGVTFRRHERLARALGASFEAGGIATSSWRVRRAPSCASRRAGG